MPFVPERDEATKQSAKDCIHALERFAAFAMTTPNLSFLPLFLPSYSGLFEGPDRTDRPIAFPDVMLRMTMSPAAARFGRPRKIKRKAEA